MSPPARPASSGNIKRPAWTASSDTTGRDKGIDLRYAPASNDSLIVQCKHYGGSSYATLLSHLKGRELPKVQKLSPDRYVLATSLGLTPDNIDALVGLFRPFTESPHDIYGRNDLNNLLGKFPDVERAHLKLWLTSLPVLERVLHNAVYVQSELDREEIHTKLKVYVQIGTLRDAARILNQTHACIVTGIPGIGKTTLAQILLALHVRKDWEVVTIHQNITEGLSRFSADPKTKQVFWYDDFLGQVSLGDKLAKNEDRAILQLIRAVAAHPNRRFVLTTREYILRQAVRQHEALSRGDLDLYKHVLALEDYSEEDKARILLNHLYFYAVPQEHINALLADRAHLRVIRHRNYSPRIVEWMTDSKLTRHCPAEDYPDRFIETLDTPAALWQHAYENQISEASRHLLMVLLSAGPEVLLEHLTKAFNAYRQFCARKYNFGTSPEDRRRSLQELEGTFVSIRKYDAGTSVAFHSPSVADFLIARLRGQPTALPDILDSCVYYDQMERLVNLLTDGRSTSGAATIIRPYTEAVVSAIRRTVGSPPTRLIRYEAHRGLPRLHMLPARHAARLLTCAEIADSLSSPELQEFAIQSVNGLCEATAVSRAHRNDLVRLLARIEGFDWISEELYSIWASTLKGYLLDRPDAWEELTPVAEWVGGHRPLLAEAELQAYAERIYDYVLDELDDVAASAGDAETIGELESDLKNIGSIFDLDFGDELARLEEYREERMPPDQDYDPDLDYGSIPGSGSCETDIEAMFDCLRDMPAAE